jgi:hypothetical protein
MAKESASSNKNAYKATRGYKAFMSNKGLLSEEQHKKLLKGEAVDLKGASEKQLQYLLTNNLIKKG